MEWGDTNLGTLPVQERSVGICLGASTLSAVRVERSPDHGVRIVDRFVRTHGGHPRGALAQLVSEIRLSARDRVAATGRRNENRQLQQVTSTESSSGSQ